MKLPEPIFSRRLLIRPFVSEDFDSFHEFLQDPIATTYLGFADEERTREGAKAFFDLILKSYGTSRQICSLAILRREDDVYLGSCGLSPLENGMDVECYYVLKTGLRGRGYAAEALEALFDYAFTEYRIRAMLALIHPDNRASEKTAASLGMTHRGWQYDLRLMVDMKRFRITEKAFRSRLAQSATRRSDGP